MAQNITTLLQKDNAEDISLADLLYLVQGTGSDRDRKMTLGQLVDFIKANRLDGMTIGTSGEIRTSSGQPVITGFAAILAGTIEALTKFKVGNSEWEPNDGKPLLTGLYALEAGNVGAANVRVDCIDSNGTDGEGQQLSVIEIKKRLVKDASYANEKLLLGPTEVGGDLKATGEINAFGGLKLENHVWNATQEQATIDHMSNTLKNGQIAVIINDGNSDETFQATTGSPNARSFTVPHDAAVMVVKSGNRVYPIGGVLA